MKIADVNLLIYAVDTTAPQHGRARAWLEEQLSGVETFGLPVAVILAFLRLTTQGRVFSSPLAPGEAFDIVNDWLARPCVTVVTPGNRHLQLVRELLEPLGAAGNLVSDAHLAALAVEHGAELVSADNDFARFRRLRWSNPLTD